MANIIFRFQVILEEHENVLRVIDILPTQNFLDLQNVIGRAFNFSVLSNARFYRCDHNWIKSKKPILTEINPGEEQTILKDKISDPHQKFYHVFHEEAGWNFFVEMIKIFPSENSGLEYPMVVEASGAAPPQFPSAVPPAEGDEEDFEIDDVSDIEEEEILSEEPLDDMIIDQPESGSDNEED